MFQKQLKTMGLTPTQANVLNFLLGFGENKASDIAKAIRQPRGVVYKALEELMSLSLVEKIEEKTQITRFRAEHPRKLEVLLEREERELIHHKKLFNEIVPELTSQYNLAINKPGLRFYEGKEGMEKVLYDTLTSKTETYLLIHRDAMAESSIFDEVNEEYKRKRMQKGISKKIIRVGGKPELTFGTADAKYDALTNIRYLTKKAFPFKTNIHIYDNKISYFIIEKKKMIGIMIEDQNIYELNKFWFQTLWEIAKP